MMENDFSQKIKKTALKNANNRCERCWTTKDLQVHHILPKKLGGKSNIENSIVLCHYCHMIVPQDGFLFYNYFLRFSSSKEMILYFNEKDENDALDKLAEEYKMSSSELRRHINSHKTSHVQAIKKGMEETFYKKGHAGFNIPYGYDLINGILQVNEKEEIIVKKIYSLYLKNHGMGKIAKILNDQNVPSKRNKKWSSQSISLILKNQLYAGYNHWCNNKKIGNHQALISLNDFNNVQKLIQEKKR